MLSELFGHEKGSFTGAVEKRLGKFELADKGTLFLDEIGDMSLDIQAKMLRVLEESSFERVGGVRRISVDIRVITATNKNLVDYISAGKFRADLFYRINIVSLNLPPLRERPQDIPLLVEHFINKYNKRYNKAVSGASEAVLAVWTTYQWPGNVRELQNIINQAVLLSPGPLIESAGICVGGDLFGQQGIVCDGLPKGASLKEYARTVTARYEKAAIEHALRLHFFNQSKTAQALHITRKTLARKIAELNITVRK